KGFGACMAFVSIGNGDVAKVAECAAKNQDLKGFGACMALVSTNVIPKGDVAKLAECAATNQGDYLGTGICMVSDKTNLTPEQQIALQCLAESADGYTYAACVGGQLTIREFIKCQSDDFAKGGCFGPNNEIRKFFKNTFNQDINDKTVLGQ